MSEAKVCPYRIKNCYRCIHSYIEIKEPKECIEDGWKECEAKLVCELGVLK